MWIVRLALRRPYTFVVVALLIVVLGLVSMSRMPTDIFPDVDIPVVSVVWSFTGISPEDTLIIPTSALIIQATGPRVAVLGAEQKVRVQAVELGRDYGATVEIVRGIEPGDQVITSPPDGLSEISVVRIAPTPAPVGSGKKS